ncbi:uncharacterized protein LOC129744959 [Uranotaenia lowii]|uniref:uncharacterized protein LOC129744959 n=1 Tax=Uranotaenia lowii TaxID=190385 RepID=UPI00247A9EE3|nr:uncharacterized protein LOC129744959 [Uranotaenia lowii]
MLKTTFKQKYRQLMHFLCFDPKRLVRVIVLSICSVIVIFQLTECFQKLIHPPVSTHSRFDLNESMLYPAVTFCRNPSYKQDVLERYNLSYHPKYTSNFNKFNFEENTLEQLFTEATFNESEFFVQFGLEGNPENVEVTSGIHLDMGRCFTLNPLVTTNHSWKDAGYSVMLKHDTREKYYYLGQDTPGWHVFIHDKSEGFAENRMQTSGRIEYLYMEVDEEVEVKLTTQHFYMLPTDDNLCTTEVEMSSTRCSELCHWSRVIDRVGCSGPWMPEADVEPCDTANETKQLMKHYKLLQDMDSSVCGCQQPCSSTIFTAYIMNRKHFELDIPAAQIWLYYTSKLVTIVEEFHSYDLAQFVADLGGSLGFLLGLSVLGLIGLMEKIVELVFIRRILAERKRKENEKSHKSSCEGSEDGGKDEGKPDSISQTFSSGGTDTTLAVGSVKY